MSGTKCGQPSHKQPYMDHLVKNVRYQEGLINKHIFKKPLYDTAYHRKPLPTEVHLQVQRYYKMHWGAQSKS